HALVGSCAQIGKRVHLSAGAIIGGVLEPVNASPVIIEDDVFSGGNCGIFEGVIVKKGAIIAAGVNITSSTPVYDSISGQYLNRKNNFPLIIPEAAVIIPGNRKLRSNPDISINCPVIIKYRDQKSNNSVTLEEVLRQ
ncbi:MAG: DapH/DapD/GlmU-related protein, partial [Candidatus Cloacimonetes bacterium]|nr:DapH/DapD/GlmU-related protein [Candidatus Cloacimonadota bacterium]